MTTSDASDVWVVDFDEVETRFDTCERAAKHVATLEHHERGRIVVTIDHGPTTFWYRIFGIKRRVGCAFMIEWHTGYASLAFSDENWSEYWAVDNEHPVHPSEEVRRAISHGEPTPQPKEQCIEKERAFAAIREYFASESRPAWLQYEYVK